VLKSIHRSGRNHGIIGAVRATHQVGHVQQEVSLVKALKSLAFNNWYEGFIYFILAKYIGLRMLGLKGFHSALMQSTILVWNMLKRMSLTSTACRAFHRACSFQVWIDDRGGTGGSQMFPAELPFLQVASYILYHSTGLFVWSNMAMEHPYMDYRGLSTACQRINPPEGSRTNSGR